VFAALRPFSPLTPALDAVRAILTGSAGVSISTLTLVGWLLIALTASAVAIARRRTTTLAAVLAGA
jgi:putative membrane protein